MNFTLNRSAMWQLYMWTFKEVCLIIRNRQRAYRHCYAGHYLDEMRFQELDELEKEGLKYDYVKHGAREIPKVS